MPSRKINLPTDTWVDVSLGEEKGTITHNTGLSDILFVQSTLAPALTPPRNNAVTSVMRPSNDVKLPKVQYFSGLSAERIWACSEGGNSVVVMTEAEV